MNEKRVIERSFGATAAELWAMWTTREGFESWFAPGGFRTVVHLIEARPDGRLHFDMIAESPEIVALMREMSFPVKHYQQCSFPVFLPCERLEFSILMDFVPGVEPYQNVIAVEFQPEPDGVRMVAALSPTHSEEHTNMCAETLARQFAAMERALAKRAPAERAPAERAIAQPPKS